ncbi:MAG: DUF1616 domain-containing protein [Anaerolineae bacterium]
MSLRDEFLIIAGLGGVLLILIATGVQGMPAVLPMVRLLLGLAFVLFVPGYALQAAVFPRQDAQRVDGLERWALSFGLSIAVVPPLALVLNWLPWGLRLWPIVIGEALVIAGFSLVALWRRKRLPPEARYRIRGQLDLQGWWAAQDRFNRVLYGVMATALLVGLGATASILLVPNPADFFTEFYALGPEGLAESYPRDAVVGQPVTVTLGITNLEGEPVTYRVQVIVEDQVIGEAGPVTLAHEEAWEQEVSYAMLESGDDQRVLFHLCRADRLKGEAPYRSLRLWIDVKEPTYN